MTKKEDTKKILVVDDYRSMRHLCSQALEEAGYEVDMASDGIEALKMLTSSCYDLVVTDIDMPNLDGISLYNSAVRYDPAFKDSFLFMTGSSSDNVWFETNGLNKICLLKPFKVSELTDGVERLLCSPFRGERKKAEKRLEERFNAMTESKVLVEDVQNRDILLGRAADLSTHGLKVNCKTGVLKEGSEVNLCLYFNYLCVVRNAKVVWSRKTGESGSVAGLHLVSPLTELSMMSEVPAAYNHQDRHAHTMISPA